MIGIPIEEATGVDPRLLVRAELLIKRLIKDELATVDSLRQALREIEQCLDNR